MAVSPSRKAFNALVASAVATMLAQGAQAADPGKPAAAPKSAGKCVHNCAGHAECKGNGNAAGKGKNSCANSGIVPKVCSDQKAEAGCKDAKTAKGEQICTWYPG